MAGNVFSEFDHRGRHYLTIAANKLKHDAE